MKRIAGHIKKTKEPDKHPSVFKSTYFLLKELSWTIGTIAGIYALFLQYQQAKPIFYAECHLAADGRMKTDVAKDIANVGFYSYCAVRNVGAKAADLVDVRSGLLFNGVIPYKPELTPRVYERADEIAVNGEILSKPLTIQPGSQATVKAVFYLPISKFESPKVFEAIKLCQLAAPIETTGQFSICLSKANLAWTDFLRRSYREPVIVETSFYDGLAGVFMLSNGKFVSSELEFRYGWGWSCRPLPNQRLEPLPKYIRDDICRDIPSN
jgi:hypothetical protein